MKHFIIWDAISYAWTEIGLEDSDYPRYAKKFKQEYENWDEIKKVALLDVCGSFSVMTFLICPCMLWMIMPDWGYEEDFIKKKMEKWYSKPIWYHFLNPIRLIGYPIAIVVSGTIYRKLKRAFAKEINNS